MAQRYYPRLDLGAAPSNPVIGSHSKSLLHAHTVISLVRHGTQTQKNIIMGSGAVWPTSDRRCLDLHFECTIRVTLEEVHMYSALRTPGGNSESLYPSVSAFDIWMISCRTNSEFIKSQTIIKLFDPFIWQSNVCLHILTRRRCCQQNYEWNASVLGENTRNTTSSQRQTTLMQQPSATYVHQIPPLFLWLA